MKNRKAGPVLVHRAGLSCVTILFSCWTAVEARELTFEERVKAQEAVERVYYAHQIGEKRAFEDAVPRVVLERKVRTYLKQSVALEKIWNTSVTGGMLRAETERMARQTRMPERLRQLFAALGDDPFLVQECLARPALADRLSRNFFAYDSTIHAQARRSAESLREDLAQGRVDFRSEHPSRTVTDLVRVDPQDRGRSHHREEASFREAPGPARLELGPEEYDRRRDRLPGRVGEIGAIVEEHDAFVIRVVLQMNEGNVRVASYSVPKLKRDEWWQAVEKDLVEGLVQVVQAADGPLPPLRLDQPGAFQSTSCLPDDTWEGVSLHRAPDPRAGHSALWTGSRMIVWGGAGTTSLDTGGQYDPATDSWTSTSTTNAPFPLDGHLAVWTGTEMIVWGRSGAANTGGRYDPVGDTWTPISTTNAPSPRSGYSVVWTGSLMVVWGGFDSSTISRLNTGGRYDPATDTWTPTSTTNAPSPRNGHTAIWTGSLMVVWGGSGGGAGYPDSGGRYDPASDTWTTTSTVNAPSPRGLHTAIWTGSLMLIWGGSGTDTVGLSTGGRYDPATDAWTPTSTTNAPPSRKGHTAVWTGNSMVVWGGLGNSSPGFTIAGGQYDPATDTWTATSGVSAPSGRYGHTAVWTGSLMLIWGGGDVGSYFDTGGRYDPIANTWTPTAISNAPSSRKDHTAIWTGSLMIVWGGVFASNLNTGGRYDPATDTWTPTSRVNAPSSRTRNSAVWTGDLMVVWGGYLGSSDTNSGGRYDPVTDSWTSTSTVNAPSPRYFHTAVWAGNLMLVWGGAFALGGSLNSGGRYDPLTDTWTPIATADSPSPRAAHTAVWTGNLMVVWGGVDDNVSYVNTGGRYDPATNTWASTSTVNAPSLGEGYTAIWTGDLMVVWGGYIGGTSWLNIGGRYNPGTDTWTPTATANAPSPRYGHTAVWTGSLMVVWGGHSGGPSSLATGGRYDPATDAWAATSTTGAPAPRWSHTAVWTGSFMVVWGGDGDNRYLDSGGRYFLGQSIDNDRDGFSECQGDCNDGNVAVYLGADEICDSVDNDCDGVTDNAPVPAGTPLLAADPSGGSTLLSWSSVGQATGYDVVRGDLSILRSSGGDFVSATQICLADNMGGTSLEDGAPVGVGAAYWYLIRAVNCGGPGTYDSGGSGQVGSRDGEINTSPSSCP